ncbi:hypothetical protein AX774_g198 [Zancudomyces culisetae]|uniref:DUF4139 domain-containing protein n=1 Tax=Zancudomyces culisetae TaxID=1213189 RepID=A0A1R1PZD6_ZANCU|nr:hypothetical protein AX774_g198 [Zancudomyces culisetae]|eukprot:OMH86306.1 hypothetical protein AX774_g198 [Zancudomyces culisetae]
MPIDIARNGDAEGEYMDLTPDDVDESKLRDELRKAELGMVMLEKKRLMLDATFLPGKETGGEKSFAGNPAFVLMAMQEDDATDKFERILQYYADHSAMLEKKMSDQEKLIKKIKYLIREYEGNHECSMFVKSNCTVITMYINAEEDLETEITINYGVTGVKWVPIYDIRVDKFHEKFSIYYGGDIYQGTGEVWENSMISVVTSFGLKNQYRFPRLAKWEIYARDAAEFQPNNEQQETEDDEESDFEKQVKEKTTRTIETEKHKDLVLEIPDFKKILRTDKELNVDSRKYYAYVNNTYTSSGKLDFVRPYEEFDINLGPDNSILMINPEPNVVLSSGWLLSSSFGKCESKNTFQGSKTYDRTGITAFDKVVPKLEGDQRSDFSEDVLEWMVDPLTEILYSNVPPGKRPRRGTPMEDVGNKVMEKTEIEQHLVKPFIKSTLVINF